MTHAWADDMPDEETKIRFKVALVQQPNKIEQSKKCVVSCRFNTQATFTPLFYHEDEKRLLVYDSGFPDDYVITTFPSHSKARSAIWHTLEYYKQAGIFKADGSEYHANDFEVREAQS